MTRLSRLTRVAPAALGLTCAAALAACATTPVPGEELLATATLLDTDGNPTGALPDFKSAGGHLNPANKGHGLLDNDGSHLGDLPNLVVAANGTASVQVPLDGTRTYVIDQIFDADGTAVVIHADADDGRTDPSGNAGSRERCGVLEQA